MVGILLIFIFLPKIKKEPKLYWDFHIVWDLLVLYKDTTGPVQGQHQSWGWDGVGGLTVAP